MKSMPLKIVAEVVETRKIKEGKTEVTKPKYVLNTFQLL